MTQSMIAQAQQPLQVQSFVIHDLTNGKSSAGIRPGDVVVTDSGVHVAVADGRRGLSLRLVEARHA